MNESVLDASALLAYLNEEPGVDIVEKALAAGTAIGTVNWAEVLSKAMETDSDQRSRDSSSSLSITKSTCLT